MKRKQSMTVLAGAFFACCVFPARALAQEAIPTPEADAEVSRAGAVDNGLNRPDLFMTDPSLPAPLHVIAGVGLGSLTHTGEERPVGAGPLLPTFNAEVGLLSRLSLYAQGELAYNQPGQAADTNFGIAVGAHVLLTDPRARDFRVALQAAAGSDFSGQFNMQLNVAAAWEIQRLRLAGSVTGLRYFSAVSDGLDVNGTLSASYQLPMDFRLGVESIAQDMEELFQAAAEGGTTVYVGPTLGWELAHRFEIVAGPMFGVTAGASQVLARGAASVLF
jgi:hypothetical protein